MDLRGISDITDFFILATGTSDRMLQSLVDSVDEKVKSEHGIDPVVDGHSDSGWMIMDYGYVMVHLLSPEMREYYELEELWQKAKVVLRLQ